MKTGTLPRARGAAAHTEDFMGSLSMWHWIIVLAVGLLLFGGRGKISELMGDVAKGIKSFKKGMSEDETADASAKSDAMKSLDHQSPSVKRAEAGSKVEGTLS
jgi:sec-independent protein translocase protein TatA